MKISVLGTGYVGLVAGACFSDAGNHVTCIDVDKEKIRRLERGEIPLYEPGLEDLITRNTRGKRLKFSIEDSSIQDSEVVFVAVGTPPKSDGSSDLNPFFSAVEKVKSLAKKEIVLIIKSTVPVGTASQVKQSVKNSKARVEVVSNPEFLKEGTAVSDFLKPERVVIGTDSTRARQVMKDLYTPFVRSGNPIIYTSNESAEMSKYAANTFLAMKISFINELAVLSERVGADIHEVRNVLITDSRIGHQFLYPGCGYGGSCFPKDVLSLIDVGRDHGMVLDLFKAVHAINERQKGVLFEKISKHFKGRLQGKKIAVWGLSFKPLTDDMREAPSITLIQSLLSAGVVVRAYDPVVCREAERLFENKIELFQDPYDAVKDTDALAIVTEWNEFRSPDFQALKSSMAQPVVFDGRNLYSRESLLQKGFTYYCIGRKDL